MLKDVTDSAIKGKALDLAAAAVTGGSFGGIVTSAISDVLMPPIGFWPGNVDVQEALLEGAADRGSGREGLSTTLFSPSQSRPHAFLCASQ